MKTVGFVKSHKENEQRRALLPEHVNSLPKEILQNIYIEEGYAANMGINDDEFSSLGIKVVSREDALLCDIICDPKIGDAEYLNSLHEGQTIFGWVHAVQNRDITDKIINSGLTAVAWEDMNDLGRHIFWRNNEIAGEAAIMHAFSLYGFFPYEAKVAVIGNGNVARGAMRILVSLGAEIMQYTRKTEKMFVREMGDYDVIVNCLLWDTHRKDHIINRSDLSKLKKGGMIIDISCDRAGAVETSIPTTIDNPTYEVDGILHYVVDHTPSIFYRTISRSLSEIVCTYLPELMTDNIGKTLSGAICIEKGVIRDSRIIDFQNR